MVGKKKNGITIMLIISILILSGCTKDESQEESDYGEDDEYKEWIYWCNLPTWNATYLLDNIIDQFTAGLRYPDKPLFYVTSDNAENPKISATYWRLGSLGLYEYNNKVPYFTNWDNTYLMRREITPIEEGTPYSQEVPPEKRTAQFTIRIPLDYSESLADTTIHPYFKNYLPTTWNGEYGSYVDSSSFNLFADNFSIQPLLGNRLLTSCIETREVFPMASQNDLLGIQAYIQLVNNSSYEGTLEYNMDYMSPDIQTTSLFSMMGSDNDYEQAFGDSYEWAALKSQYLQLPNETGELPNPCYVRGNLVSNTNNEYAIWAPTIVANATEFKKKFSNHNVFGKAYAIMQEFSTNGSLPFVYDEEMWLGYQPGFKMPHPEEYEDYNEWFFCRGSGVSIHFASAYTTILRLMGIPSRVVIGFLGGNDSLAYYPYRMISPRYLHAWTEVLVPVDPLEGAPYAEWVSFDPLINYFTE